MTKYSQGANFERKVKKELEALGWFVVRSAGSKGKADLVAFSGYEYLLIQCKKHGAISKDEKKHLVEISEKTNTIPILAREGGYFELQSENTMRVYEPKDLT